MEKMMDKRVIEEIKEFRTADFPVNSLLMHRWSPRSMTGEKLDGDSIMSLFEAARWAPSAFNSQPWRFIYAERETPEWDGLFALLTPGNKSWCEKAALLIVVISSTTFEHNGKPNKTHAFVSGSAWENLALQATTMGLVSHAMAGFDYQQAVSSLGIPDEYQVMCMVAVGHRGSVSELAEDLREREKPSDRLPVESLTMKGRFSG
jgi:nitroreductase